jgi:tRNA threonylcarbamoyladenosine biosynthesis protein TsaB
MLAEAGTSVAALDGIAFGAGPGAFTGLRVACGAAQGLAVASDRLLLPVSSLEAMALQAGDGNVLALLDARMGEAYAARYCCSGSDCRLIGEIRVQAPDDIVLPEDAGWRACGNAPAAYPALAARLQAAAIELLPGILPTAAAVARLASPRLARGEGIDAALAAPLYIRDKVAKTVAERLEEGGRA